jgi:uncharacterized protein YaiL (DUF2058 family)
LLELRKALEITEEKLVDSRQEEERLKLHYEANIEELIMKVNVQFMDVHAHDNIYYLHN